MQLRLNVVGIYVCAMFLLFYQVNYENVSIVICLIFRERELNGRYIALFY